MSSNEMSSSTSQEIMNAVGVLKKVNFGAIVRAAAEKYVNIHFGGPGQYGWVFSGWTFYHSFDNILIEFECSNHHGNANETHVYETPVADILDLELFTKKLIEAEKLSRNRKLKLQITEIDTKITGAIEKFQKLEKAKLTLVQNDVEVPDDIHNIINDAIKGIKYYESKRNQFLADNMISDEHLDEILQVQDSDE